MSRMSDDKIPFIKPEFPPLEDLKALFEQIYINNFYTNNGPYYFEFKKEIEGYFGQDIKACILANATLALILSLKSTLLKGKAKVIVPSFTFSAGPLSIVWAGYSPVFIDIEIDTWQPDIKKADKYIEENHDDIAGILLCNTFGVGNEAIENWEDIAIKYSLPLVIDSAAGFGSRYNSREKVGGRGNCEVFSLHATKPFGIGEGGIVLSEDSKLIEKLERMKNFGFNSEGVSDIQGMNAKITEFSCAIGVLLLPHLDSKVAARQKILKKYKIELEKFGFKFQPNDEASTVAFISTLVPSEMDRDRLIDILKKYNIESRRYYYPATHKHPLFKNEEILNMDNTGKIANRIISLPAYEHMTDSDFRRIISVITRCIKKENL